MRACTLHLERQSWAEAVASCKSDGAQLVTSTSAAKNAALLSAFEAGGGIAYGLWLGGSDESGEGMWEWTDGSMLPVAAGEGYTNWMRGEPSGGHGENCLNMWRARSGRTAGTWNGVSPPP